MHNTLAIDFETFYDTKNDFSASTIGVHAYARDKRLDPYLVSLATRTWSWVGHPKDAPWDLAQQYTTWLSHNAGFDRTVYREIFKRWWPKWHPTRPAVAKEPDAWHCTANMSVYLSAPRDLAGGAELLLNKRVSKDVRKKMDGVHWGDLPETLAEHPDPDNKDRVPTKEELRDYALADSTLLLDLWEQCSDRWPEDERRLSDLTYQMGDRGVLFDSDTAREYIKALEHTMWQADQLLPWYPDKSRLSKKAMSLECAKLGIIPPVSLAMGNEETDAWFDEYAERAPFAKAMRTWRRANGMRSKLENMLLRVNPENGRLQYSLFYFGASTGRWSGSGGVNMQNISRDVWYLLKDGGIVSNGREHARLKALSTEARAEVVSTGVDFRGLLQAPAGKKLLIADSAQIEARVTLDIVDDQESLELVRKGISIYEVHARQTMGWTGGELKKEDPRKYLLAKARVLALGYQAGDFKFRVMAKSYLPDEEDYNAVFEAPIVRSDVSDYLNYKLWYHEKNNSIPAWRLYWSRLSGQHRLHHINAWKQVTDFRKKNPLIVAKWKEYQQLLDEAAIGSHYLEIPLKSGRCLRYYDVHRSKSGGVTCRQTMGRATSHIYGGMILENVAQATARDFFAPTLLKTDDYGLDLVLQTHDEQVSEIDEGADASFIEHVMTEPPTWASDFPLGVEWELADKYKK